MVQCILKMIGTYIQAVLFPPQHHCCFWIQLCWLLWQQYCSWCRKWDQSVRLPAHSLTDFLCHGRYYCSSWYQCRPPVGRIHRVDIAGVNSRDLTLGLILLDLTLRYYIQLWKWILYDWSGYWWVDNSLYKRLAVRKRPGAYNVGSKNSIWHSRCFPGHHNGPLIDVW